MKSDIKFNLPNTETTLEEKVQQFKEDEEKMQDMHSFMDGLLTEAAEEAQRRQDIKLVRGYWLIKKYKYL